MNNSKNPTVREIVQKLEAENRIEYEISHRGGKYGAAVDDVIGALFPTICDSYSNVYQKIKNLLPNKIGAWVNYLGGGLRGSICRSDYSKELPAKYAKRIDAFTRECKRRYLEIENGEGLNDTEDADGETNWDALGTNRSRAAGVKQSAYLK